MAPPGTAADPMEQVGPGAVAVTAIQALRQLVVMAA